MNKRLASLLIGGALGVGLVSGSLLPDSKSWAQSPSTPHTRSCTAYVHITLWEDGSAKWDTRELILTEEGKSRVLDAHWAWRMPKWGWMPEVNGMSCRVINKR